LKGETGRPPGGKEKCDRISKVRGGGELGRKKEKMRERIIEGGFGRIENKRPSKPTRDIEGTRGGKNSPALIRGRGVKGGQEQGKRRV